MQPITMKNRFFTKEVGGTNTIDMKQFSLESIENIVFSDYR